MRLPANLGRLSDNINIKAAVLDVTRVPAVHPIAELSIYAHGAEYNGTHDDRLILVLS